MEFSREELSEQLLRDFAEQEAARESNAPFRIFVPLIMLAVVGFGLYAWQTDKFAVSRNNAGEPPLVMADESPVRFKPKDPGGLQIPNMDKKVYDAIAKEEEVPELPKVVQLMPEPEQVIDREVIAAGNANASVKQPVTQEINKNMPTEAAVRVEDTPDVQEEKLVAKQELASADMEVKVEKPEISVENIKVVSVPDNKTLTEKTLVQPKQGLKVQLGSFRSKEDVSLNWRKIKEKFPKVLNGEEMITQKADLGDKGVFYRLQVGNYENEDRARAVCQELIAEKQGCFVVKK